GAVWLRMTARFPRPAGAEIGDRTECRIGDIRKGDRCVVGLRGACEHGAVRLSQLDERNGHARDRWIKEAGGVVDYADRDSARGLRESRFGDERAGAAG